MFPFLLMTSTIHEIATDELSVRISLLQTEDGNHQIAIIAFDDESFTIRADQVQTLVNLLETLQSYIKEFPFEELCE